VLEEHGTAVGFNPLNPNPPAVIFGQSSVVVPLPLPTPQRVKFIGPIQPQSQRLHKMP